MSTTEAHPVDLWPGRTMKNGFIVLQFNSDTRVVLAMNPEDSFCQFVTWDVYDCGGAVSGDYHVELSDALSAYEMRVEQARR